MWLVTNNIDSYSIEWELITFINIRVLRLRNTDWKSSLNLPKKRTIQALHTNAASGKCLTLTVTRVNFISQNNFSYIWLNSPWENFAIHEAAFTSTNQKRHSYDSFLLISCRIVKRISDLINAEDGLYT